MGAWLTKVFEDEKRPIYHPQYNPRPPARHEHRPRPAPSSSCPCTSTPPVARIYAPIPLAAQEKTTTFRNSLPAPAQPESLPPQKSGLLKNSPAPALPENLPSQKSVLFTSLPAPALPESAPSHKSVRSTSLPAPGLPESLPPQKSVLFMNEVSEWTLQDVVNKDLLVHKVRKIPDRFWNVEQYFDYFKWLLVEEVRAQLHESLKMIGTIPYAQVHQVLLGGSGEDPERTRIEVLVDRQLVPRASDVEVNETGEKVQLFPKDLVLLTTILPGCLDDLKQNGVLHAFALVLKLGGKMKPKSDAQMWTSMAIQTSKERTKLRQDLLGGTRPWYALYLDNLIPTLRICEALHPRQDITESNFPIIHETLYVDRPLKSVIKASAEASRTADVVADAAREYCESRKLNESQTSAIVDIISDLEKQRSPFVRMIQGPPGTGKTSTIVGLLALAHSLNLKCLVTAPTNAAIAEIARQYTQFLSSCCNPGARSEKAQLARFRSKIVRGGTWIEFKDAVLLGNSQKLVEKKGLQDLFLPQRVDRLMLAQTGWKNATRSILALLVSGKSQFDKKCNEIRVANPHVDAYDDRKTYFASFLDYVRDTLPNLVKEAELHAKSLIRELPTSLLIDGKKVLKTVDLAIKLRDLVLKFDSSLAEYFPEAFAAPPAPSSLRWQQKNKMDKPPRQNSSLAEYFPESFSAPAPSSLRWQEKNEMDKPPRQNSLTEEVIAASTDLRYHLETVKITAFQGRDFIDALCTKTARVVFCTVAAAGRDRVKDAKPFNLLIVDEAGQLNEAETAIVSQMPGLGHVVLVGDQQQLRATVISEVAVRCGYGRSLFERLQNLGHPSHLLSIQYRMHPAISSFPNSQFYEGRIADGENVKSAQYQQIYQKLLFGPCAFIDVQEGPEENDSDTGNRSMKNPAEVALVSVIIRKLSQVIAANNLSDVSVGVIAPYSSQIKLLRKHVRRNPNITLEINSVDGFQGQEMDIILVSTVRANTGGHIGFLKDHRRMNVALTRARYCSWVVGDARTLSRNDIVWSAFVNNAIHRKLYISVKNDLEMHNEVQHIKRKIQKSELK